MSVKLYLSGSRQKMLRRLSTFLPWRSIRCSRRGRRGRRRRTFRLRRAGSACGRLVLLATGVGNVSSGIAADDDPRLDAIISAGCRTLHSGKKIDQQHAVRYYRSQFPMGMAARLVARWNYPLIGSFLSSLQISRPKSISPPTNVARHILAMKV